MLNELSKLDRDFIKWVRRERGGSGLVTYEEIERRFGIDDQVRDELLTRMQHLGIGWKRDKGLDAGVRAFKLEYVVLNEYASAILDEERETKQ